MIRIKLSEVMGRHRVSQAELIRRAGIRPNTVSSLYHEKAKRLRLENLNKLCRVLNCQVSDLLEYVPDEE